MPLTREEYIKKSKTQKIVGFVFLGSGAIALLSVSAGNTDFNTLGNVVAIGGLSTLASIPLFIASAKNKRKAKNATLSFNFEKIKPLQQTQLSVQSLSAISIKLYL
jgi:hypothetical protein